MRLPATVRAMRFWTRLALALLLGGATASCNRAIEPYSDEPVVAPDLSKIFPPGAERAPQDAPMGAASGQGQAARGAPPPSAAATGDGEAVSGTVTVAPELANRVAPGAVLFVVVRMGDAGPPVAVKRVERPVFPLSFEIGPGDRMIQGMPFTGPFRLTARLDSDGNATSRTPGDLQGTYPAPVSPGAHDLALVIDQPL